MRKNKQTNECHPHLLTTLKPKDENRNHKYVRSHQERWHQSCEYRDCPGHPSHSIDAVSADGGNGRPRQCAGGGVIPAKSALNSRTAPRTTSPSRKPTHSPSSSRQTTGAQNFGRTRPAAGGMASITRRRWRGMDRGILWSWMRTCKAGALDSWARRGAL